MRANFHVDYAVRGIQTSAMEVCLRGAGQVWTPGEGPVVPLDAKPKPYREMLTSATEIADAISGNSSDFSPGRRLEAQMHTENAPTKCEKTVRMGTFRRWLRFNFVGGIGIIVQFVALFLMKTILHLDYLAATALAVEAAVVHNFLWHERYTWADRVQTSWPRSTPRTSGAEPQNLLRKLAAARKRRATPMLCRPSFTRFFRFNLTTGGVSILGNLALMRVMVGAGHMNYLVANGIAIALCSLANFVVSEEWVFAED